MALERFMVHINDIGVILGPDTWPQLYGLFSP